MRLIAAIFGIANISLVLVDAFEAMVLPRRATRMYRPARLFYRSLWIVWRIAAHWIRPGAQRQHFLSFFGPLSLLALFACWVAGLIFSSRSRCFTGCARCRISPILRCVGNNSLRASFTFAMCGASMKLSCFVDREQGTE